MMKVLAPQQLPMPAINNSSFFPDNPSLDEEMKRLFIHLPIDAIQKPKPSGKSKLIKFLILLFL